MRKSVAVLGLVMGAALLLLAAACSGATNTTRSGGERDTSVQNFSAQQPGSSQNKSQNLPDVNGRKIVRTATMDLSVEGIGAAVSHIGRIANAAGGFVSDSNIEASSGSDQKGTVTVRVPAQKFDDVMGQLRGLATGVRSETSKASEVTEEYTDLQSRLKSQQAALDRYRQLFDKAQAIGDVMQVQDRIDTVQTEIERIQGRLNVLNDLTDLATITVNLGLPAAGEGQNWAVRTLEVAWDASLALLVVFAMIAIAGGVFLVWLVPVGLVVLLLWRRFERRLTALAKRLYEA